LVEQKKKESKLDLTVKTYPKETRPTAQIYFGFRPPKNWRLNSILQKDSDYQKLRKAWDNETDPEIKEQLHMKLLEYRAKVRNVHNLPDED